MPTLPFGEIESIMSAIDSLQPDLLHYHNNNGPASRSFQCFGVFDASSTRSITAGQVLLDTEKRPASPSATRTSPRHTGESQSLVATTQSEESIDDIVPIPSLNHHDPTSNNSPQLNTQVHLDNFSSGLSHAGDGVFAGSPISAPELGNDALFYNDLSFAFNPFQEAFPSHGWDTDIQLSDAHSERCDILDSQGMEEPSFHSIPMGLSANALTNEETFLMHHYATKVVHLFCTLDNPKSPWQTIHLPRALQSAGELVVLKSTSGIRHSLRNALLAISAFCLSNDYKIQIKQDLAQKWNRRGTYYRGKSIMHLKQALDSGLSSEPRPKYKEILATMLSMISINVRSDLAIKQTSRNS